MAFPTVASTDLGAVVHNATVIRNMVGSSRLCAVVKANAYGHGAGPVSHALAAAGADMFAVAAADEAVELREAGIRHPILLLGPLVAGDIEVLLDFDVIASVTDEAFAGELARQALARGTQAPVHMKVNTGMHRLGFDWETAAQAFLRLHRTDGLRATGIFTHFACADADDLSFSHEQKRRFRSVLGQLCRAGLEGPILAHAANSCGVLRLPDARFDAVRPGLILYGLRPLPDMSPEVDLRPVMALRTRIGHRRHVRRGEGIGYGHAFTAWRDSTIGILPLGYADGYPRALSNVGEVLVRGVRVPVVGRVCMDQTLVDLTDVPGVQVGDEVVLYGQQGTERVTVDDMAARIGAISYELSCAVGRRVRREFVLNGVVVVEPGRQPSVSAQTVEQVAILTAATAHERLPQQPAERGAD
jgi:alanine racemase